MADQLELCPKCLTGHLRPTGQSSTAEEILNYLEKLVQCVCLPAIMILRYKKPEGELNEYIPIGETLEMKVVKGNTEDNTKENTDQ